MDTWSTQEYFSFTIKIILKNTISRHLLQTNLVFHSDPSHLLVILAYRQKYNPEIPNGFQIDDHEDKKNEALRRHPVSFTSCREIKS